MDTTNSDNQSNGLVSLLGTLGTAYFGAQAAEATATATAQQKAAVGTSLDSTGHPVATPAATVAAGQWVAGVSNKAVMIAAGGLVVALVLVIALRSHR